MRSRLRGDLTGMYTHFPVFGKAPYLEEKLMIRKYQIIEVLTAVAKSAVKEKVSRMVIATFRVCPCPPTCWLSNYRGNVPPGFSARHGRMPPRGRILWPPRKQSGSGRSEGGQSGRCREGEGVGGRDVIKASRAVGYLLAGDR